MPDRDWLNVILADLGEAQEDRHNEGQNDRHEAHEYRHQESKKDRHQEARRTANKTKLIPLYCTAVAKTQMQ